jgi:hypothetical protein
MNTWQEAKQIATQLTGRTPRWCDVRDENDELAPAPIPEAMDDCLALDANGNQVEIRWMNQQPRGSSIEAVCYF